MSGNDPIHALYDQLNESEERCRGIREDPSSVTFRFERERLELERTKIRALLLIAARLEERP